MKSLREEDKRVDEKLRRDFRLQLRLLARLASLPSLKRLSREEKQSLVEEAKQAGINNGLFDKFATFLTKDGKAEKAWGERLAPTAWNVIWETYPWARRLINGLLDGKTVRPPSLRQNTELVLDRLALGIPWARPARKYSPFEGLIDNLVQSLKVAPFPYHRCPWCKTTVFLWNTGRRGRPREYCSPACKSHANEAARKGTRGEYIRNLVATKRARKKARAKAEERAKKQASAPVVTIRGTLTGKREKR